MFNNLTVLSVLPGTWHGVARRSTKATVTTLSLWVPASRSSVVTVFAVLRGRSMVDVHRFTTIRRVMCHIFCPAGGLMGRERCDCRRGALSVMIGCPMIEGW